jgi:hypothetical protein
LAINPGDGILTWKPLSGNEWEMPGGALTLDIPGATFCHLLNLYKDDTPKRKKVINEGKHETRCTFRISFRWFTWTSTDADHMQPLGYLGLTIKDTLWTSYKNALEQGISDPEMVLPDPRQRHYLKGYAPLPPTS